MSAPLRGLRALRLPASRRCASNDTVSAAKDKASATASAAQATAQQYAGKATAALQGAGQRASGLLGAYKEPVTYNLRVAGEVAKQVYIAERLAPPTSVAEVQAITSQAWAQASQPSFWTNLVQSGQWRTFSLYALEAYFIFKIGEAIGRRHLVGYKLNPSPSSIPSAH